MPLFPKFRWKFAGWRIAGLILVTAIWGIASHAIQSSLILPSPGTVLSALLRLAAISKFWQAVLASFSRVFESFFISLLLGLCTGIIAGLRSEIEAFISPLITGIRATPVLALILLAMFWFPAGQVPVFSAVLMTFPVIHTSVVAGVRGVDHRLIEMSNLFRVPKHVQLMRLRIPAAIPFLLAGAKNGIGLSWKVVVAGEVLSQPTRALGTGMQEYRLMLETPAVFAWALTTILLCGLTEYLFGLFVNYFFHRSLPNRTSLHGGS